MNYHTMRLIRCESGATAIEYGLIVTCIALGMLLGFRLFSNSITGSYNDTSQQIQDATD